MSKLDKDDVLAKFTEAYKAVNGKEPQIEAKSGWYSVDGGKNIRLAQLVEMAEEMMSSETVSNTESEQTTSAPKSSASVTKANTGGFSVKNFWASKIKEENAGANLPR